VGNSVDGSYIKARTIVTEASQRPETPPFVNVGPAIAQQNSLAALPPKEDEDHELQ
jgi:hypothetical protein